VIGSFVKTLHILDMSGHTSQRAHMDSCARSRLKQNMERIGVQSEEFFSQMGYGANDLYPPNIPAEWLNAHYAVISTDSS